VFGFGGFFFLKTICLLDGEVPWMVCDASNESSASQWNFVLMKYVPSW